MIIILMGVSGCGKTTIGEQLALEQGLPFFDADNLVTKSKISVDPAPNKILSVLITLFFAIA